MSFSAVVSVKGTKGGSGSSGVARYIAESKRDERREGKDARPLFDGKENDLTYRAANRLVSPDKGGPEKRDIIHLVISLEKDDYERMARPRRSGWRGSAFDFKRRADARAMRRVNEQDILDRDARRSRRQELFEQDVTGHSHGISNHRAILGKTVEKTEADLRQAQQVYDGLRHSTTVITRSYESSGRELPVPLLTPRELFSLEFQAISSRKPECLLALEKIRFALAAERGVATRADREAGRLQGQLIVARTDEAARQTPRRVRAVAPPDPLGSRRR